MIAQVEDWFEISHNQIREIGREIGKGKKYILENVWRLIVKIIFIHSTGAFGRVFIAKISEIPGKAFSNQIVAIKKLKSE
jgi:hypothetical protein